jgi:hypothetical protein
VRLVVNEIPYQGPQAAGHTCLGPGKFFPPNAGPDSFVLADKLAFCRFAYLDRPWELNVIPRWLPRFTGTTTWPQGVRIEMAPMDPDASRLQPISIVAPIRVLRSPEIAYGDY